MMKKKLILLMFGILVLSFTGCQKIEKNPDTSMEQTSEGNSEEEVTESGKRLYMVNYLLDEDSKIQVDKLFTQAGISEERRKVFWNHVEQINACEGVKELKAGYHEQSAAEIEYDPYALQDAWNTASPEFVGYNCRITAFSLMGDYIDIADTSEYNDANLFLDIEALGADDSACIKADDLERFKTLFSTYSTENTKDMSTHLEVVRKAWKKAGITFCENPYMSLISIFFHDQFSEDENELSIGHTGVLFDMGKEGLFFVEKRAFQEPYDVIRFDSRQELADYMLEKYDLGFNQPTARPFIMENDQLMEYEPEDAPFFVADYYDYYKTDRGYHKRSLNSNGGWNVIGCMSFMNQPSLKYSNEIRSAVLVMHGEMANC